MANIFKIDRPNNKITLGTTGTTINVPPQTASRLLALDASKDLTTKAIGSDVQAYHANLAAIAAGTWTGAASITTLGTISTVGNITIANGGTIGQAAGPLLTFDDTNNHLEITGCKVGIGTSALSTSIMTIGGSISSSGFLFGQYYSPSLISSDQHVYALYAVPSMEVPNSKWGSVLCAICQTFTVSSGTGSYAAIYGAGIVNLTGTIDNAYGLYLAQIAKTGVTSSYGIYSSGALDKNYFAGNTGIGIISFGTNATKTFAIGTGVAPTTSPADCFQIYSADIAAGHAAPHIRNENNTIIKLYQQAHITDAPGDTTANNAVTINAILTALENNGLLASA